MDDVNIIYKNPTAGLENKPLNSVFEKKHEPDLPSKESRRKADTILTQQIYDLAVKYSEELVGAQKAFAPIRVDEIASRLARFYETVRKIVDWKDDSVLRRGAIERILKRVLFTKIAGIEEKNVDVEKLAETVTLELIRGGHLPNDAIPTERVEIVSESLKKYLFFLEYLNNYKPSQVKKRVNVTTFILEIASCEVEEILTRPVKEYGIIDAMTEMLTERIRVAPKNKLTNKEIQRYVFIATCRTLYDLDTNFIIYRLLQIKYPDWKNPDTESVRAIASELPNTWKELKMELNLPITRKFSGLTERIDTVFMLIDDILDELKDKPKTIVKTLENKKRFKSLISKAYDKRHKTLKRRLFRLAIFSTLSVFLSNWFTFFIVEVPLARLFYEGFSFSAAVVDFAIPTALMFFLVIIIKPPKKDNLKKVLKTSLGFVYQDENWEYYQIKIKGDKPSMFQIVMSALYIYTMFLVFIGIAAVFYYANLPLTSVAFDTFTIALTVFAAVTIKNRARELNVDEHTSVWDFILDIVSVPVAKVGSFFTAKWKEYNIIAIFFSFIFETPFALLLNFIQGWSEYIKERRSELH